MIPERWRLRRRTASERGPKSSPVAPSALGPFGAGLLWSCGPYRQRLVALRSADLEPDGRCYLVLDAPPVGQRSHDLKPPAPGSVEGVTSRPRRIEARPRIGNLDAHHRFGRAHADPDDLRVW